MTVIKASSTDRPNDGYEEFSVTIRQCFTQSLANDGPQLFTTDASNLFDVFLTNLPSEARQHYTCNACRQFVNRYGGIVVIAATGEAKPAMWTNDVPELFAMSVFEMRRTIKRANVTGVLLHGSATLGTPVTGEWHHMSVINAPVFRHSLKTPFQAMAEKSEDYQVLQRSLHEFTTETVEQAVRLLKSEALYRSDRVLGVAEWLLKLHKAMQSTTDTKKRNNLVWLAVASAPVGFSHVRSSMIGTLLEDIESGMSFDAVSRRFADKMNPSQYQRAQVAPTQGNIDQAEKLVKKLGLENWLQRRYLTIDEIPAFVWKPKPVEAKPRTGGVFANIAPKGKATGTANGIELPAITMTWDKFQRTVLPTAAKVEIKADNNNRFAALVTAQHPNSPNILQWDNGVSWYYHGGVDAEIRRRVEQAGGRYENNEIRCSLLWNTYSDLDIHVESPRDGHIFFGNKRGQYGWLDVDMNVSRTTLEPVENLRWQVAPEGQYQFYVNNYTNRATYNSYKVELEICGKVFTFEGMITRNKETVPIATFNYKKGVVPTITGTTAIANGTAWNLEANQFHTVTGIVKSPNLWGDNPATHAGDHTFFLIDGCKDIEQGKGRGFFNEMLKPELREIRKTLEAYTASTPIDGADTATACGLGFSKSNEWNVTVRVTDGNGVTLYKLDRYD